MQNPLTEYKINPEIFEVATEYTKTLSLDQTAQSLGISKDQVVSILEKAEVKRYIDAIFLQQGYMERNKLNDVMTHLIDLKLEEMEETGLGSNKDILEILKFAHQMRQDNLKKEEAPGQQVNIQNNFGENYSNLLQKIVSGGDPIDAS